MNPKNHRKDFNRRWEITSSDSYEEAFKKFKQRIINIFILFLRKSLFGFGDDGIYYFCQYYGIAKSSWEHISKNPIMNRLYNENNEKEFYCLIEVICLALQKSFPKYFPQKKYFSTVQQIQEAVQMSDVNLTLALSRDERIILHPEGEPKLDEDLVNKTLSFLNEKSNHHFEEALKFYQKRDPIESAENLRRALEEFLRHKLQNTKGFQANIKILRKELEEKGAPPEIRNITHKIFDYLDKYFNEHSKHGSRDIPEPENEFLIYQTGLLLRYINAFDLTKSQEDE